MDALLHVVLLYTVINTSYIIILYNICVYAHVCVRMCGWMCAYVASLDIYIL